MILDFRSLQKPSIELVLLDDENTVIHVETPTQGALLRLKAMQKEVAAMKGKTDSKTLSKMYDLCAELMSFNRERLTITGEELREKYRIEEDHLLAFELAYLDFIAEIKSAKN